MKSVDYKVYLLESVTDFHTPVHTCSENVSWFFCQFFLTVDTVVNHNTHTHTCSLMSTDSQLIKLSSCCAALPVTRCLFSDFSHLNRCSDRITTLELWDTSTCLFVCLYTALMSRLISWCHLYGLTSEVTLNTKLSVKLDEIRICF